MDFFCFLRHEAEGGRTISLRIQGRRSLYDFVWRELMTNLKKNNRKPAARRHVVGASCGHHAEAAR